MMRALINLLGRFKARRAAGKAPAFDPEGGSPELPAFAAEPDHVREKREAYARRRALPSRSPASAREFAEARAAKEVR
jgi:hypothetical protein